MAKKPTKGDIDVRHYDVIVAPHITEKATLLSEQYAANGGTVVMATHDHDFAMTAGARIVSLTDGRITGEEAEEEEDEEEEEITAAGDGITGPVA